MQAEGDAERGDREDDDSLSEQAEGPEQLGDDDDQRQRNDRIRNPRDEPAPDRDKV